MSNYLDDEIQKIRRLLQDNPADSTDFVLGFVDLQSIVDEHILYLFSAEVPRIRRKFYAGEGEYDYALPDDWLEDYSVALSVEYEEGAQIPDVEEPDDWIIYEPDIRTYDIADASTGGTSVTLSTASNALYFKDGHVITIKDGTNSETNRVVTDGDTSTGAVVVSALSNDYTGATINRERVLRFLNNSPSNTSAFILKYTTAHTLTNSENTIPVALRPAFRELGAAIAATIIANHYRYSHDSSLSADSVDNLEKASQWDGVSKKHYSSFKMMLGSSTDVTAANATAEWDVQFPWRREYVFRPNSWH